MKFKIYSDPSHAWLKVPMAFIQKAPEEVKEVINNASSFSYMSPNAIFLEEDKDMPNFLNALKAAGIGFTLQEEYPSQKDSSIRRYLPYHPLTLHVGEIIETPNGNTYHVLGWFGPQCFKIKDVLREITMHMGYNALWAFPRNISTVNAQEVQNV